jgi:Mg-chelatase subunit ChlI-like protein
VLVGLPDSALYQARDRCKAAVSNSGQEWPIWLLTINLSPPTLPKAGSHYDDAIVARCSRAEGVFRAEELRSTVLLGELGLDGRLRPVRGPRPSRPGGRRSWSRSPTTCPTPRTEGFNRVIKQTKRGGCGSHNMINYQRRILSHSAVTRPHRSAALQTSGH